MQPFLDLRRAAQRTGSRRASALPAHRDGQLWKFKVSEVDDWVRAGGADEAEREGEKDGR